MAITRFTVDTKVIDVRMNQMVDEIDSAIGQNTSDLNAHKAETAYEVTSRTIYVSVSTGNDTNGTGSVSQPYKTITKALATVNKNISANIIIRVLAGDYRSEGHIYINNFRGTSLMITAFDGVNDVFTPNDAYLVERITMYDCEGIYLQGFKCHPTSGQYGIYMSNCRFVKISGYKNEVTGASGLGCTGNSFVWVENSTGKNLSTVISANHGARVVSQNWITSINNNNGIIVDVGSIVHLYDDAQPVATNLITKQNGGVLFYKNGISVNGNKIPVTTFLNTWGNMNSGYEPLTYWKDAEGCVHVQGVVNGGAVGSSIFNLPIGYRPSLAIDGIGTSGNSGVFAAVRLYANGDIQHLSGGATQLSINLMFKP